MSPVNASRDHERVIKSATKPAANKHFECGNSGAAILSRPD
jgi:hypothetical protein